MSTNHPTPKQSGFTIVEVAIIVPILSLMVTSIVVVLVTLITSMAIQTGKNTLTYDTKAALSQLEADVQRSSTFIGTTLPSTYNSGTLPSNSSQAAPSFYKTSGTNPFGISNQYVTIRTLVLKSYDQMKNPNGSQSTVPVVLGTPPCSSLFAVSSTTTLPVAITYFVDRGTLYRRVTPDNTTTATCGTPLIKKNCPTVAADCTPKDTALVSGVMKLDIQYYTSPTTTSSMGTAVYNASYPSGAQPSIETATTIEVTLEVRKRVAGTDLDYPITVRINKTN